MTKEFPFTYDIQIDWSEIDSFGHVNNLAIMRYVQSTRIAWLEQLGMMQHHKDTGIGPILASISTQFKKQLFYPGRVVVHARIEQVKNTSFHIIYSLFNEAGELAAEAHDVIVMIDFETNVKCPIPPIFRKKFKVLGIPGAL